MASVVLAWPKQHTPKKNDTHTNTSTVGYDRKSIGSSSGWVLGWRHCVLLETSSIELFVVAGVIPYSSLQPDEKAKQSDELDVLRSKIRNMPALSLCPCCCCRRRYNRNSKQGRRPVEHRTNSQQQQQQPPANAIGTTDNTPVQSSCCPRQLCLQTLEVILRYKADEDPLNAKRRSDHVSRQSGIDIPVVTLSNQGFPVLHFSSGAKESASMREQRQHQHHPDRSIQVLIYERNSPTLNAANDVLYHIPSETLNSATSTTGLLLSSSSLLEYLLVRLTHVGTIWHVVVNQIDSLPTTSRDNDDHERSSILTSVLMSNVQMIQRLAQSKSGSGDISYGHTIGTNSEANRSVNGIDSTTALNNFVVTVLCKYSLLARHFMQGRKRRILGRERSWLPLSTVCNAVIGQRLETGQWLSSRPSCSCGDDDDGTNSDEVLPTAARETEESAFSATVDVLAGLLIVALAIFGEPFSTAVQLHLSAMYLSHYQLLSTSLKWLGENPLGIKLNERLMESVGREIQRFWNVHESVVTRLFASWNAALTHSLGYSRVGSISTRLLLLLLGMILGGSGLAALYLDTVRVATLHISVVAQVTRRVYAAELNLLSATWRLFRGKKRNIVRNNRTDSMEYDYMQLLVGTILFAVALFLFTTVFVYHVFFSLLYVGPVVLGAMLFPGIMVYQILQEMPYTILWLRHQRPKLFSRSVVLEDVLEHDLPKHVDVTMLDAGRTRGYTSILFAAFRAPLMSTISWLALFLVGVLVGGGDDAARSLSLLDTILPMQDTSTNA